MKLTERIGSDENVLWYGKKAWYVTAAEAMLNLFLPYLLIWPLLKGVFIVRPGLLARLERSIFIELMIELLPIWLMIYLVVVLCKVIGSRQTEYCVTDKGVYVVFGNAVPKKLVRKPFGALTDVKCKRGLLDKLLGTGVVSATSATMVGEPGSELSVRGVYVADGQPENKQPVPQQDHQDTAP